jgi:hypothetical protein
MAGFHSIRSGKSELAADVGTKEKCTHLFRWHCYFFLILLMHPLSYHMFSAKTLAKKTKGLIFGTKLHNQNTSRLTSIDA